jgi:hypothetical protein
MLNIQRCNRDAERYTSILHVAQRMLVTVILSYVILTFLRNKTPVLHNTLNIKAPTYVQQIEGYTQKYINELIVYINILFWYLHCSHLS